MEVILISSPMSHGSALVVVDYYTRPGNTQAGNFADLFIDNSGNFYATYCSGDQRAFKLTLAGNTWSSTNIIAPGTYNCPVGITVLPNGDIYLGIQDNGQNPSVFKIPAGTSLPTANSGSGFQGLFSGIGCPGTFAFDPTYSTMYVSCGCASKIYTVDMGTLAVTSTSAQEFNVYGIATDAEGAIYVAATTSGVYKIANPKVSMVPVRLANINTPHQNNIYIALLECAWTRSPTFFTQSTTITTTSTRSTQLLEITCFSPPRRADIVPDASLTKTATST
jgi:hypothetical protein